MGSLVHIARLPPTLHRAYVANKTSNTVTVIDTTTNTVVGTPIPVGSAPTAWGWTRRVHRAYVARQGSNNVTVIDTTTNTVVGTPIPVGTDPFAVGVDPTVHRAYVANPQQQRDGDRHDDQHRRGRSYCRGDPPCRRGDRAIAARALAPILRRAGGANRARIARSVVPSSPFPGTR